MNVKFKLITDNAACTYIIKKPDLSPRLARWAIQLADYDFEIIHQAGKQNVVADALSRAKILSVESCLIDEQTRNQQKRDYFLGPVLLKLTITISISINNNIKFNITINMKFKLIVKLSILINNNY